MLTKVLQTIQSAFRDGVNVVLRIFEQIVGAAVDGMRLAAADAAEAVNPSSMRNVVTLNGRFVWKVDKYILHEGKNNEQCASVMCENGNVVHVTLGINVESIEQYYATVTRIDDSTLHIKVMCTQGTRIESGYDIG